MLGKIKYTLSILGLLLFARCANMVTPTGGANDITPPKVTEAVPENRSTGFDGKKIELSFDEYITLENANQNVLFSPPLKEKPDIKLSNKTVVIKLKEPLEPNTTYTIGFGNAIKDLHEGNVFNDYVYSFSTGEVLDTLSITGKVLDAESKKPVEDLFVGLYNQQGDSLFFQPTLRQPDYITKTDKEGRFALNGLPEQSFLIFALKDVNSNLYYDMPNEMVAFLDTLITTTPDTASTKHSELILYAFTEMDTTQMLLEKKLVEEGLLRFVFRHPARAVSIETPDLLPDTFQIVKVWSATDDTLWWYFTPNVIDSLRVNIQYDTLINDSTRYSLKYRESTQRRRSAPKKLKVSNNLKNNLLMPDEDFLLKFSEPVTSDTIRVNDMVFEKVDDQRMDFRLKKTIHDTASYSVNITDSVFYSLRGYTNDSIHVNFKRATEKDIGNIFITVVPPSNTQLVIQLKNSRGAVVDTCVIDQERRVEFKRLSPEKYKLSAIIDKDRDGKWSSGNFHRGFLPETVVDYKDELDVKPGWDIDLEEAWVF